MEYKTQTALKDAAGNSPQTATLPIDDQFNLLSNSRRRAVIRAMYRADGRLEFTTLVDRVAQIEYDRPIEEIDSNERKSIQSSLHQSHLPKLIQTDVVESIDGRVSGTISPGPHLEMLHRGLMQFVGRKSIEGAVGDLLK